MPASAKKQTVPKVKKPVFYYECTNAQGANIKGEISALNLSFAKGELKRQGLNIVKIRKKSLTFSIFNSKKAVSAAEISVFSRQLATMLIAGIPLVQAFDIIAKGTENVSVKMLINSIKSEVEAGRPFSETLRQHPRQFDDLYCNLVSAGEASGSLDVMLDRIATYKEKTESMKRKVKKALFYPTAIVLVAIAVSAILLIFVVPQFEQLFQGFGADLPLFTQLVIHLSKLMQAYWWVALSLFVLTIYLFSYLKRNVPTFSHTLDKGILKFPIIGKILHKAAIARFARTLATTFAAGVPLIEALESVAGATGNIVYYNAVNRIREDVATGSQINTAMKNTAVFPNMVVQMIAVGEESGALDDMLSKVANIYEEEVDTAVDGLSSLLEPLIMVILGILVGGLVIAMYLPIFKMGSAI